ncbi:hypothetical protein LDENG_00270270, partial [Lucifuga dentata]
FEIIPYYEILALLFHNALPIISPSVNEDYVNRKSVHSINMQVVCHAAPTSSVTWKQSGLGLCMTRKYFMCTLSTRFAHEEFDGYLLGEYSCQPCLLTPYPDTEPATFSLLDIIYGDIQKLSAL